MTQRGFASMLLLGSLLSSSTSAQSNTAGNVVAGDCNAVGSGNHVTCNDLDTIRQALEPQLRRQLDRVLPSLEAQRKLFQSLVLRASETSSLEHALLLRKFDELKLDIKRDTQQIVSEALEESHVKALEFQPSALDAVLGRALHVLPVFRNAPILWIDDRAGSNRGLRDLLGRLGARVEPVRSTAEALDAIATGETFSLIISDIRRENDDGVTGLLKLRKAGCNAPAVFYVTDVDRSRAAPATALGITNRPDELLHFVIDGLERSRWSALPSSASGARGSRGKRAGP